MQDLLYIEQSVLLFSINLASLDGLRRIHLNGLLIVMLTENNRKFCESVMIHSLYYRLTGRKGRHLNAYKAFVKKVLVH